MIQRRRLLAAGASALFGCASGPPPSVTVAESARRSVLAARRFGWLSSRQETGALPSGIALGAAPAGRVLLFFEFEALADARGLLRAELLLSTGGAPGRSIEVELSRAEATRAELRRWSDQPRALFPRLSARLASAAEPARLDVTELARAESKPGEPLRMLLRAEPRGDEPILVRTGVAGGVTPALEAYFQ